MPPSLVSYLSPLGSRLSISLLQAATSSPADALSAVSENVGPRATASVFLGYSSLGCWLVAQAPQIVENIRLQSCEGLALPFLVNWLCGDITNLVGCILTGQREFQTLIAAYFCAIDLLLTGQYAYYSHMQRQRRRQRRLHRSRSRSRPGYASTADSHRHVPSAESAQGIAIDGNDSDASSSDSELSQPPDSPVQYLPGLPLVSANDRRSSTALDELADAVTGVVRSFSRSRSRPSLRPDGHMYSSKRSRRHSNRTTDSLDGEADFLDGAEMRDSIYSESSSRPRSTPGGSPNLGVSTAYHSDVDVRGRASHRLPKSWIEEGVPEEEGEPDESSFTLRQTPPSESRDLRPLSTSRSSKKKTATGPALFMGIGLMFGLSRLMGQHTVGSNTKIISTVPERDNGHVFWPEMAQPTVGSTELLTTTIDIPSLGTASVAPASDIPERVIRDRRRAEQQKLYIGRISAWISTTLYLTSRLPQIWKNFTRKSCEGLSVLLFLFAFMGNVTYVASILILPEGPNGDPRDAGKYLLEALPYLLGSGGTTIFDLIIMMQSFLYREMKPTDRRDSDGELEDDALASPTSFKSSRGRAITRAPEAQPLLSNSQSGHQASQDKSSGDNNASS